MITAFEKCHSVVPILIHLVVFEINGHTYMFVSLPCNAYSFCKLCKECIYVKMLILLLIYIHVSMKQFA
jgi:hypothetical protein